MTTPEDPGARLRRYLQLAAEIPELFSNPPGSPRILFDAADVARVEQETAAELAQAGEPPDAAQVGVIVRDPRFYLVRDALEFPDGDRRTYARILSRLAGGVVVLPVLAQKIVLVRHFRHPMRRVLLEAPRGGIDAGDAPETTARNEIREEIGGVLRRLEPLGHMYGNSALYSSGAHLYFAELDAIGEPQTGEGVQAIEQFTTAEFERQLLEGNILDSFTICAYTHARLRGLL